MGKAPNHLIEQCARLLDLASPMSGLDDELQALRTRVETADFVALRVGLRRIVEALLRHVAREMEFKDAKWRGAAELETLKQEIVPMIRAKVGDDFGLHVNALQHFGNASAHLRTEDVYCVGGLRPVGEWTSVQSCLSALEHLIIAFQHLYPPPTGALEPGDDAPESPSGEPAGERPRGASTSDDLGAMTVAQVRTDNALREMVLRQTGWTTTKLTRRLNAVRGNTLLRTIAPGVFAAGETATATSARRQDPDETTILSYEGIGDLTLKQAQDLELEEDIAKLSGLSIRTVTGRMSRRRGNAVVRRAFPEWYDGGVIASLTSRTALEYGLAPLLARHMHKRTTTVVTALREVYGQTKLGTVFPMLLEEGT